MRWRFLPASGVLVALMSVAAAPAQPDPNQTAQVSVDRVRALALRDQDDRPFSLGRMLGTVTVLNFVYTGCGGQCPLQTAQLAAVQAALPDGVARGVQFISVSVDPEHDFPAGLRQFALDRGADLRNWHFLTGSPEDVDAVAGFFRARPPAASGLDPIANHATTIQLFDPSGAGVMRYGGTAVDQERLVADLTYLVAHARPALPASSADAR